MPARRVTAVTVPVDGRSAVVFEAYPSRTPLLSIMASRPRCWSPSPCPSTSKPGHVRFARDLAASAARYAIEVERTWRGLPSCRPTRT